MGRENVALLVASLELGRQGNSRERGDVIFLLSFPFLFGLMRKFQAADCQPKLPTGWQSSGAVSCLNGNR